MAVSLLAGCTSQDEPALGDNPDAGPPPMNLGVRVERTYPHAEDAFTQGLVYRPPWLYESTGLYGESTLRRVDFETGVVDDSVELESTLFGEGLALVDNRLIQLTWKEGRALVWNMDSFTIEREHSYEGEGWGLCHDGVQLWMSDGSSTLQRRDSETFELLGTLSVNYQGSPVDELNELECVGSDVFANVWQFDHIVRIDTRTGQVTAWIETGDLLSHPDVEATGMEDVLNGIAFIPERERLLLTGKLWPRSFEVELVPAGFDAGP